MKVMISQSNYIPWHGFFAAIRSVDLYIILDTVQFTRRDWRSRNRIQMDEQVRWLTIPTLGSRSQCINEVRIAGNKWNRTHYATIRQAYRDSLTVDSLALLRDTYESVRDFQRLTDINENMLVKLSRAFGIGTPILRSEDFPDSADPSERLALIAEAAGATQYWTGPSASNYLDTGAFIERSIEVCTFDFSLVSGMRDDIQSGSSATLSIIHDIAVHGIEQAGNRASGICFGND